MASHKFLKPFFQSFLLSTLLTAQQILCNLETDTISSNSSIKDPNTIVSKGNVFKLGFFTPENSTNRYLGIFYVVSEETVVWVANRNKPLTDSSGTATISRDGNLVLSNGQNETVWSTNTTSSSPLNTTAQILDTGNLVLRDVSSGHVVWESFLHPSHVIIPGVKAMNDTGTTKKESLSSWKSLSDPAVGNFTLGVQFRDIIELYTWKNGKPYWRSGPWNGRTHLGVMADLSTLSKSGFRVEHDSSGVAYTVVLPDKDFLMKVTLDPIGRVIQSFWDDRTKKWTESGYLPGHDCDVYGKCGPFGSCNRNDSPICSCLRGFEPRDKEEWDRGNWTGGCVRRTQLQCGGQDSNTTSDGFVTLRFMKVPDFPEKFVPENEDECKTRCLGKCSCIAHAYEPNIGCMFWSESLIDVQQFPNVGLDLYIRLARSELDEGENTKLIIIISVISGFIFISVCIFIGVRRMLERKDKRGNDKDMSHGAQTLSTDSDAIILVDDSNKLLIERLPQFTVEMLANATNQFGDENLLGKGGFGPVYKGNLANGKEIAVKRLSETSGQGGKEFMNEVIVISKLQHKNLVRLVGYCTCAEEKMLVYEFMPNKSLDECLFDLRNPLRNILHWGQRRNIIEGVGRGMLYLHKDSRMKIIHRDLKPSNVLLDEDWNPKISDFGMARIFGGNQDQGNTSRVVGTYGYMAPEYATEGRFSEKSDVYSFGVLMLEIISGKKNTHYYNQELSLSLLGCAWKFWSEDNCSAFQDPLLMTNSNTKDEIMRCIHIALLCIQEFATDRPDIQTILSMLSKEIINLPQPEKPVFAEKWNRFHVSPNQPASKLEQSINQLSLSVFSGR